MDLTPPRKASIISHLGGGETSVRFCNASGPEVFEDPRLAEQLQILTGRRLSQFSMGLGPIRLAFWGEETGSVTREVAIEHPTLELAQASGSPETRESNDEVVATSLLGAVGKALTRIDVTGGHLSMAFEHGLQVHVEPDRQYESWQINSEDHLLIVCAPGGELTMWLPTELGD